MTPEQAMHNHLAECRLHAAVLGEALSEAQAWLPLAADAMRHLGKEQRRILDQAAYRFAKLLDTLGQKVLPLVLELAQEPIAPDASFAEKLNWLERIGALRSAEEWKKLRIARNAIAHDYPDDPALQAAAINRFLIGAAQLGGLHGHVDEYVRQHFPNAWEAAK